MRPIVVLPQPDSPTKSNVWPEPMEKDTPDTALTDPAARSRMPAVIGNSFTRPSTRSSVLAGSVARSTTPADDRCSGTDGASSVVPSGTGVDVVSGSAGGSTSSGPDTGCQHA